MQRGKARPRPRNGPADFQAEFWHLDAAAILGGPGRTGLDDVGGEYFARLSKLWEGCDSGRLLRLSLCCAVTGETLSAFTSPCRPFPYGSPFGSAWGAFRRNMRTRLCDGRALKDLLPPRSQSFHTEGAGSPWTARFSTFEPASKSH